MEIKDLTIVYYGGDSYPHDSHIEDKMRQFLPIRFIDHASILGKYQDGIFTDKIAHRLETLQKLLDDLPDENFIVVGRSSGARVATLYGSTYPRRLRGIVCLGYPFKHPNLPIASERIAHLADLDVPTLIIQGEHDNYGGAESAARYHLSPCISFQVVPATHEFNILDNIWDDIGCRVWNFIENL